MKIKALVDTWFQKWDDGDFENIPVSEDFKHTSPYGTINGREAYLALVRANTDKFLGNQIVLHDQIYQEDHGCVRYTVSKGDFAMEVSEWFYMTNGKLNEIISYYNIPGEISESRKLTDLDP